MMANSKAGSDPPENNKSEDQVESDPESDEESEVLEESPCGRWQKRREEVQQRDVPGIDNAFLAMDTEEGVEVVWNEVSISEKKSSKTQLETIKQVFDNLIQLDHANIVKFHRYWVDKVQSDQPRVVFITEYMSSGSLKQFLKKTKKNHKTLKAWKRWCTQILSALSYLHSCEPPITHGNLTCDTIFIQHNGLIKIGSVAPDAIYSHVKTRKEEARNMHYIAPEYADNLPVSTAVDIYSFGICALEMAALEIPGNGDTGHHISPESIQKALDSLDPQRKDFISKCLLENPKDRPSARDLLFHAVLFEVHSLKLLAGHAFVKNSNLLPEHQAEEAYHKKIDPQQVIADLKHSDGREPTVLIASQANTLELEKFLEDVKNGVYPLTAFAVLEPTLGRLRAVSPEVAESVKSETPEPEPAETRLAVSVHCQVRKGDEGKELLILLRMDDKISRQLTAPITEDDSSLSLADELVHYGFISKNDREKLATMIEDSLQMRASPNMSPSQMIMQTS